jgi:hypothetical protein
MLVDALNRASIHRRIAYNRWTDYFKGQLIIDNVVIVGKMLRFDLSFPNPSTDCDDYIWSTDRERGTTNKVRLMQAGKPIDARVVAIHRYGANPEQCDNTGPEELRLTFEAPQQLSGAQADRPLQVLFFQTDQGEEVLAAAPEAV